MAEVVKYISPQCGAVDNLAATVVALQWENAALKEQFAKAKRNAACPCCREGVSIEGQACSECKATGLVALAYETCRVRLKLALEQLAAAQADRERLGWLDDNPRKVVASSGYRGDTNCWSWQDNDFGFNNATTLREAIDAARAKERK